MRKSLRTVVIPVVAMIGCVACGGTTAPASTATSPVVGASIEVPATSATGRTGQESVPNSPATRASTDSSPEIKRYLGIARQAFPQRADTALIEDAQAICAKLAATSSAHDAVGELAAKLGNQTSAKQLVDAATAAYCP